jgi:hypothetical protein
MGQKLCKSAAPPDSDVEAGNSTVGHAEIKQMVDTFMADENINQRFIPDVIERHLYMRILSLLLHTVKHVVDSTKMEFMGHTLSISMQPTAAPNIDAAPEEKI